MNNLISSTDWSVLNEGYIDDSSNLFTKMFINISERCIPTYYATIRNSDNPWYNSEIRKLTNTRDKLKKKTTSSNKPHDWTEYKNIRNKVTNMIKKAKEICYSNLDNTLIEFIVQIRVYIGKLFGCL